MYTFLYHPPSEDEIKYNVAQQSDYLTDRKSGCRSRTPGNTQEGSPCNIFQRLKTVNLQHNRQLVSTNANGHKPSSNIPKGSIPDVAGIVVNVSECHI